MPEKVDPEVIEVEVERPEPGGAQSDGRGAAGGQPFRGPAGPVLAGLVLDFADLVTPANVQFGMVLGALAGLWVGSQMGLTARRLAWMTVLGAVYCGLPATTFLPLGVLVGLIAGTGSRR